MRIWGLMLTGNGFSFHFIFAGEANIPFFSEIVHFQATANSLKNWNNRKSIYSQHHSPQVICRPHYTYVGSTDLPQPPLWLHMYNLHNAAKCHTLIHDTPDWAEQWQSTANTMMQWTQPLHWTLVLVAVSHCTAVIYPNLQWVSPQKENKIISSCSEMCILSYCCTLYYKQSRHSI